MPSVCVDDCGLTTDSGELAIDWAVVGMKRQCATWSLYSQNPGFAIPNWVPLRTAQLSYVNNTCLPHRVIARMQVPWIKIKVGNGNAWQVRGFLNAAVGAPAPYDGNRSPDLLWTTNWYLAMPADTDQEQSAPGAFDKEWLVPAGQTLNAAVSIELLTPNYTVRPTNLLEIAPGQLSLSAWPASGPGANC